MRAILGMSVGSVLLLVLAGCAARAGGEIMPHAETVADLRYTPDDWPTAQHADLYLPETGGLRAAIILIHGGGWVRGERADMDGVAREAVARGYVVFNIDYRLAPQHPYPAAVEDVCAAVAWVREQATRFRVDPARVALWGYSAGGHLAAQAGVSDACGPDKVAAVIAGGMPSDLVLARDSELVRQFIGAPWPVAAARYAAASPLRGVDAGDPPVFLYHGTWDWIVDVDHARRMKAALDAVGVPAELYLLRGYGHFATFLFGGDARDAAYAFLRAQAAAPAPQPAATRINWPHSQAP